MDPRLDHSRMDHPRAPPLPPPTTTTGAATGEFRMDHHHHHHQQQQQQQQPRMLVELTGGGGRAADPRMMDARMMGQSAQQQHHQHHQHHQHQQGGGRAFEFGFTSGGGGGRREARTLEDLFHGYGVRMATLAKMTEMGFTVSTLVNMTEGELDDVIHTIAELLQMELLVGERYGVKSAIRAEKRHLDEDVERQRLELLTRTDRKRKLDDIASVVVMPPKEGVGASEQRRESMMMMPDAVSPVNPLNLNSKEPSLIMGAGHNSLTPSLLGLAEQSSDSEDKRSGKKRQKRRRPKEHGEDGEDRPREHPFIVTEPGEAARGKKNGLDYLFDLYEQCGKFLEQVQQLAREKGEKCPTKVTNQVFRHAKHTGAGYINKPKMRHYVHCYALHCLDVDQSNGMRKLYKERGENVGAWRMACYPPLVAMARDNGWDIEGLFNRNDRLRIWYVPTKLRQLCHVDKGKLESREE